MTSPRSSGSAPPLDPRTRVQFLPGIGPQRALAFDRLGITTLEHLVRHVPRTWLDASRFVKVRDLRPGELVTVMGTIKHASALRTRGGRGDFAATLVDETGTLAMYFFGQSWLARTLAPGTRVVVSGELGAGLERQMLNPMFEVLEGEVEDLLHTGRLIPVHGLTRGVTARGMRQAVHLRYALRGPPQGGDPSPDDLLSSGYRALRMMSSSHCLSQRSWCV